MRLAFFGSDDFGLLSLQALNAAGHEVAAVFTQPDRPAGRGQHMQRTPIGRFAHNLGLPVYQPETLKEGAPVKILQHIAPELAVVVAYGHLIPPSMLAVPRHGFINLHASLLPKYRGAAPVPHAILNGETQTGVTIFRLNERLDEGDILAQEVEPILPRDTSATLLARLAVLGAKVLTQTIASLIAGSIVPRPQPATGASHAPRLRKEDGRIRWNTSCAQIDRMVRAFQPWPLAFTFFPTAHGEQRRVVVLSVEPEPAASIPDSTTCLPGTILIAHAKRGIVIQCNDGCLRLTRIKPEGRSAMSDVEYMRSAVLPLRSVLI